MCGIATTFDQCYSTSGYEQADWHNMVSLNSAPVKGQLSGTCCTAKTFGIAATDARGEGVMLSSGKFTRWFLGRCARVSRGP